MSQRRTPAGYGPFPAGPISLIENAWRERALIAQLTRREVLGRYRGSIMGLAWSFLHPLLLLAVYTFVFSVVFEAKWPGLLDTHSKSRFALVLFVGVIAHGIVAEAITRAPVLVLGNANYVKKVVFPLETLGWSLVGSTLFHATVSLGILLIAKWSLEGWVPLSAWWLPVVLLPLMFFALGATWLLASLGVFIRDIAQVTGLIATVLMFLAPVFYPITALPHAYRGWLYLNPITHAIECARAALFEGRSPDAGPLALYYAAALTFMLFGYWWFQKSRRGFADVL
ncbi:MAG: ABC transporter permease [Lysobacteraceae bacterium]|nr:MAG: ABC transporter permease [Xanthomonadaceae bacterium]